MGRASSRTSRTTSTGRSWGTTRSRGTTPASRRLRRRRSRAWRASCANLRLALENVVGGDAEEQAVVELSANGVCKNGLKFDNRYAWVLKFDGDAKIVRVHAYLDSELVKRALEENE